MGTYIRRALDQDIESATLSLVIVITGPHRSGLSLTICIQRIVCRFHLACSDAANNFGSLCHSQESAANSKIRLLFAAGFWQQPLPNRHNLDSPAIGFDRAFLFHCDNDAPRHRQFFRKLLQSINFSFQGLRIRAELNAYLNSCFLVRQIEIHFNFTEFFPPEAL